MFTSDRAGDDDVYLVDANGSDVRRLTSTPGTDWLAEFSPDGATIAFATDHSTLIDTDGSNRSTLTPDAANHPSWRSATIDVSTAAVTVHTDVRRPTAAPCARADTSLIDIGAREPASRSTDRALE